MGCELTVELPELLEVTLLRRYKRFLADVRIDEAPPFTVHCPNTGAMTGCAEPGSRAWISTSDNPKRKYPHTLELVETDKGLVSVNTGRANALVGEALSGGVFAELDAVAKGKATLRAEAKIPEGDGRFDFKMKGKDDLCDTYVEVKSVTLHLGGGEGAFPDAVSARALKHLLALQKRVESGDRAVLVFCVQHLGIERVRAAHEIDPHYAQTLDAARAAGVEVFVMGAQCDLRHMTLDRLLPFGA